MLNNDPAFYNYQNPYSTGIGRLPPGHSTRNPVNEGISADSTGPGGIIGMAANLLSGPIANTLGVSTRTVDNFIGGNSKTRLSSVERMLLREKEDAIKNTLPIIAGSTNTNLNLPGADNSILQSFFPDVYSQGGSNSDAFKQFASLEGHNLSNFSEVGDDGMYVPISEQVAGNAQIMTNNLSALTTDENGNYDWDMTNGYKKQDVVSQLSNFSKSIGGTASSTLANLAGGSEEEMDAAAAGIEEVTATMKEMENFFGKNMPFSQMIDSIKRLSKGGKESLSEGEIRGMMQDMQAVGLVVDMSNEAMDRFSLVISEMVDAAGGDTGGLSVADLSGQSLLTAKAMEKDERAAAQASGKAYSGPGVEERAADLTKTVLGRDNSSNATAASANLEAAQRDPRAIKGGEATVKKMAELYAKKDYEGVLKLFKETANDSAQSNSGRILGNGTARSFGENLDALENGGVLTKDEVKIAKKDSTVNAAKSLLASQKKGISAGVDLAVKQTGAEIGGEELNDIKEYTSSSEFLAMSGKDQEGALTNLLERKGAKKEDINNLVGKIIQEIKVLDKRSGGGIKIASSAINAEKSGSAEDVRKEYGGAISNVEDAFFSDNTRDQSTTEKVAGVVNQVLKDNGEGAINSKEEFLQSVRSGMEGQVTPEMEREMNRQYEKQRYGSSLDSSYKSKIEQFKQENGGSSPGLMDSLKMATDSASEINDEAKNNGDPDLEIYRKKKAQLEEAQKFMASNSGASDADLNRHLVEFQTAQDVLTGDLSPEQAAAKRAEAAGADNPAGGAKGEGQGNSEALIQIINAIGSVVAAIQGDKGQSATTMPAQSPSK